MGPQRSSVAAVLRPEDSRSRPAIGEDAYERGLNLQGTIRLVEGHAGATVRGERLSSRNDLVIRKHVAMADEVPGGIAEEARPPRRELGARQGIERPGERVDGSDASVEELVLPVGQRGHTPVHK